MWTSARKISRQSEAPTANTSCKTRLPRKAPAIRKKHNSDGFTLLELMMVIAIVAILITLGAPSFKRLIQSTKVSSNVNSFLSDMRQARSEALSRGGNVVMCRSDDPEAASPVCSSGLGAHGWASGWIIFHDLNNDGQKSFSEPLLRIQSPITSLDSIMESKKIPSNKFRFTATGRLLNMDSATTLKFGGDPRFPPDIQRTVCVSLGGRARITGDGTTSCGSNNE